MHLKDGDTEEILEPSYMKNHILEPNKLKRLGWLSSNIRKAVTWKRCKVHSV